MNAASARSGTSTHARVAQPPPNPPRIRAMTGTPTDAAAPDDDASPSPMPSDALFAQVYDRLKSMASRKLPAHGATLQTTALVHELYLRMQTGRDLGFDAPAQFFAYAARAMRHLLRDRARDRLRLRAGGEWERKPLDADDPGLAIDDASEALALDEALDALERVNARAAQVVELRYFAGLSELEIAELLQRSERSIRRDWQKARMFLLSSMQEP